MKKEWINHALKLLQSPAELYSGSRKIIRCRTLSFYNWDHSLQLCDAGYTNSKLKQLSRGYLHEESREVAVELWEKRKLQAKYGSVGFTTYNHFIKNDPNKKSRIASVMGPCIQSCVLTWIDKKSVSIDVFYRTTEWLKKFPADLVFLRDILIAPFDLSGMKIEEINCHFANITIHPMYVVTLLANLTDPIKELENLKNKDHYFYKWVIKWTIKYLCQEYRVGIEKYSQAMRVWKIANDQIVGEKKSQLQEYLLKNYHLIKRDKDLDIDDEDD